MDKTYSLVQDTKETFSIEESWLKFPKYWYMWYHKLNKLRYLKATTGWLHDSIKDTVFSEIFIICFKILKVLFNFNYWVSLNLIASFFTDNKWHVVIEEEMVITYAISILNFHFHLPDPTQRGKYIVHTHMQTSAVASLDIERFGNSLLVLPHINLSWKSQYEQ